MPKPRTFALALLAVLAAGPASSQTLFKCVLDGKTIYQSEPCSGKATQSEIRAPSAAAVPEAPAASPDAAKAAPDPGKPASKVNAAEMEFIVDTFVGYTICSESDPGFAAKLETGFQGWKDRNAATLDRFNQDPEAGRVLDSRLQQERQRMQSDPGSARATRIEMCARTAGRVAPQPPR